ncbi:MAG: hypothetical protein CM1200mP10_25150 [Candidatus Neomarinimicrobiota bacterium]|nr:MAG: hypothetical protein CM1200mP10_25150 [Candidatus Neomarinimicrobiota bacterium]
MFTGGRGWGKKKSPAKPPNGHELMQKGTAEDRYSDLEFDGKYLFDKVTDVYYSATVHEEDQFSTFACSRYGYLYYKMAEEYNNPCKKFFVLQML